MIAGGCSSGRAEAEQQQQTAAEAEWSSRQETRSQIC